VTSSERVLSRSPLARRCPAHRVATVTIARADSADRGSYRVWVLVLVRHAMPAHGPDMPARDWLLAPQGRVAARLDAPRSPESEPHEGLLGSLMVCGDGGLIHSQAGAKNSFAMTLTRLRGTMSCGRNLAGALWSAFDGRTARSDCTCSCTAWRMGGLPLRRLSSMINEPVKPSGPRPTSPNPIVIRVLTRFGE
jgi:hypothetical protein